MSRFLRSFCHFLRYRDDGIAAVEFALTVPFLLALFLGGTELTRYMLIDEKVMKVAITVSDAASQGETISKADLDNIFTAAAQVMLPYSFGAGGYVIVTSVTQTGAYTISNPPKVSWQYSGGGTWTKTSQVGSVGNTATLPGGLTLNDKDNIILTEVFYNFVPIFTTGVLPQTTMYQTGMYKPRLGSLTTLGFLTDIPAAKGA